MPRRLTQAREFVEKLDSLPDDGRLPADAVATLFAVSRRTLLRKVKDGSIPAPTDQSPLTFNVGAIRRTLRSLT